MKKQNKVKGEKGIYIAVATALMTKGVTAITEGNYPVGLTCIVTSILIFFLREHFKLNRWSKMLEEN